METEPDKETREETRKYFRSLARRVNKLPPQKREYIDYLIKTVEREIDYQLRRR